MCSFTILHFMKLFATSVWFNSAPPLLSFTTRAKASRTHAIHVVETWGWRNEFLILTVMEASCMQLSIEGERLLKAHDYQGAIDFFEAGIRAGTDDKEVLSAVYNQLGNACFYIGKFHKALEYHKKVGISNSNWF